MPFAQLARIACYSGTGAVIIGNGYSSYGVEPLDLNNGIGNGGTSYSFTAQTAKVGVDMETGQIQVTGFHHCLRLRPLVEPANGGRANRGWGDSGTWADDL